MRLSLLKIPVEDLARGVRFYGALFDRPPVFEAAEFGWAQFDLDGLHIALYVPGRGGGDRTPGGSVDFHLVSDAIDRLAERLAAYPDAGAAVFENADGSRSFECRDPDGNALKIMG